MKLNRVHRRQRRSRHFQFTTVAGSLVSLIAVEYGGGSIFGISMISLTVLPLLVLSVEESCRFSFCILAV